MISKLLEKIRSKPEPVRKSITLLASIGITGVVFMFWVVSYVHYIKDAMSADIPIESPTTFVSRVSSLVGESYANVRERMKSATEALNPAPTSSSSTDGTVIEGDIYASGTEATVNQGEPLILVPSENSPNLVSTSTVQQSVELDDILNTKSKDYKATTSSKLLIQ